MIVAQKRINPILGKINNIEHSITLHTETPIRHKGYHVPLKILSDTKEELNKPIILGVIRKSKSLFCSPAFPILKKNGNIRFVIDYRQLNKQTIPITFPMPHIHEFLQQLKGSTIFSQLDLNLGYYQIQITLKDIHKTAFVICNEQ